MPQSFHVRRASSIHQESRDKTILNSTTIAPEDLQCTHEQVLQPTGLRNRRQNIRLPTPNSQNFRIQPLNIKERLAVGINRNRGTQQEISDSTKVSKEIAPFQQEFPIQECNVKNDPTGHPESESDKKSDFS